MVNKKFQLDNTHRYGTEKEIISYLRKAAKD